MMRDESHAFFVIRSAVIANQSADWCGNPLVLPECCHYLGDSHAGVRTGSE